MSRPLDVYSMLPCENCCAMSVRRTPLPACVRPEPTLLAAKRSANSAREPLKPVVLTFAMLFEMTSRSAVAAFKPLSATLKGMSAIPLWDDQMISKTWDIGICPSAPTSIIGGEPFAPRLTPSTFADVYVVAVCGEPPTIAVALIEYLPGGSVPPLSPCPFQLKSVVPAAGEPRSIVLTTAPEASLICTVTDVAFAGTATAPCSVLPPVPVPGPVPPSTGPSTALDDWNMILRPSRSLGLMFAFDCSVCASVLNEVCRPCMPETRLNCVSWLKKLDGSIGCEGSCERSCVAMRRRKSLCVRSLPLAFAPCCCEYALLAELRIALM